MAPLPPSGEPGAAGGKVYQAIWRPSAAGALTLRVAEPALDDLNLMRGIEVVRTDDEMRQPAPDRERLAALAAATGGKVVPLDRLGELEKLIPNRARRTPNDLREPLWNSYLALFVIVILITAEWIGPAGGKGLNLSAFDRRTGEWRQVYVSNQVPAPSGVSIRRSDPSYSGPGIRFIALFDPPPGNLNRTRVTIMPLSDHRALQMFEDSQDGGQTWRTVFKAEHRATSAADPPQAPMLRTMDVP